LNVVDGCIPSDMATGTPEEIEEERRLLYVAMTRAKNDLDLIVPQRFFVHQQSRNGDRHVYASVSRFIPDRIHHSFDRRSWREVSDVAKPSALRPVRVVDVTARLKRMWR
jgi:DNA helicase-2/ATP-dependent DNA helicase PcrA